MKPGTIAVIGAGIGGLTAGVALRRAGFDVDIYEQAPELTEETQPGCNEMESRGPGRRDATIPGMRWASSGLLTTPEYPLAVYLGDEPALLAAYAAPSRAIRDAHITR